MPLEKAEKTCKDMQKILKPEVAQFTRAAPLVFDITETPATANCPYSLILHNHQQLPTFLSRLKPYLPRPLEALEDSAKSTPVCPPEDSDSSKVLHSPFLTLFQEHNIHNPWANEWP
jgi:hypothetical protein